MPVPGSFGIACASHARRCGRRREVQHVEREALAIERAAQHEQVVAELVDDVVDDPIVRRRGGAQHRHAGRHEIEHAREPAVVGPEVVAPVADAVRLVDHEEAGARRDVRAAPSSRKRGFAKRSGETRSRSTRRRARSASSCLPLVGVVARDPNRAHAAALARLDLVAHEREQRRDEQRRTGAAGSQQSRRDEVDRALAPAGPLDDEDPPALDDERFDGFELVGAELGVGPDELTERRQCFGGEVRHSGQRGRRMRHGRVLGHISSARRRRLWSKRTPGSSPFENARERGR